MIIGPGEQEKKNVFKSLVSSTCSKRHEKFYEESGFVTSVKCLGFWGLQHAIHLLQKKLEIPASYISHLQEGSRMLSRPLWVLKAAQ